MQLYLKSHYHQPWFAQLNTTLEHFNHHCGLFALVWMLPGTAGENSTTKMKPSLQCPATGVRTISTNRSERSIYMSFPALTPRGDASEFCTASRVWRSINVVQQCWQSPDSPVSTICRELRGIWLSTHLTVKPIVYQVHNFSLQTGIFLRTSLWWSTNLFSSHTGRWLVKVGTTQVTGALMWVVFSCMFLNLIKNSYC